MIDKQLIRKLQERNQHLKQGVSLSSDFLKAILTGKFRNFPENGKIEFKSLITAIVGKNGTGKSTVLFLAGSAYAPPLAEGQTRTIGKTFNHFIPDTQKDKMLLDSQYGFLYADGIEHQYIWHERKEGDQKRQGSREWDRRHKTSRKLKQTIFIGFEKNISNGLLLADYYNLSKKDIEGRLDIIGKNSAELIKLDDKVVERINQITGKKYSEIQRRTDKHSQLSEHCYGYVIDGQYSDIACGSGEIALIRMIDMITSAQGNSLILIDEPENGVHQSAQEKFMEFLIEQSLAKNYQIIFTTHSEFILDGLNSDSIVLLESIPGEATIYPKNSNRAIAFKAISDKLEPKVVALVEDNFAELFLQEVLDNDPGTREQIKIKSSDTSGWQQMVKKEFPKSFVAFKNVSHVSMPVLVLDGDAQLLIKKSSVENEFGSYLKIENYYNEHGLKKLLNRISKLSGMGKHGEINFKSCFKPYIQSSYTDAKLIRMIDDYLVHFLKYVIFLPGDTHPEIVLYLWLQSKTNESGDIFDKISSSIHKDKLNSFKAEFTAQVPNNPSERKQFCKNKVERLESYRTGLTSNIIFQWVSDPVNPDSVSNLISQFRRLVD